MKKFITISLLFCITISGCSEEIKTTKISNKEFTDISPTSFKTKNGDSYSLINLATNNGDYCHITLKNSDFASNNYALYSVARNNKNISITCNFDGKFFTQSKKYKSHVSVSFVNIVLNDHHGSLELSFKLVNAVNMKYLELNDFKTIIPDTLIAHLFNKNIKLPEPKNIGHKN